MNWARGQGVVAKSSVCLRGRRMKGTHIIVTPTILAYQSIFISLLHQPTKYCIIIYDILPNNLFTSPWFLGMWGRVLPYLKVVARELLHNLTSFYHFHNYLDLHSMPNWILLTLSFCRKIRFISRHHIYKNVFRSICFKLEIMSISYTALA